MDDPFDWPGVSEDEAEWRAEHPAWSVADFFAILKRQFRDLTYVPISSRAVYSTRVDEGAEDLGEVLPAVQEIYRRHGWPDRAAFDKEACKREISRVVREADGVFQVCLDAAELAEYRTRFPANLEQDRKAHV